MMHTDFKELRTAIINTGLGILFGIMAALISGLLYFAQQKDDVLRQIEQIVHNRAPVAEQPPAAKHPEAK
jgi:hypothetical protein